MTTIRNVFAVRPAALTGIESGNALANRSASHLAYPQHAGLIWQSDGNANLWVRGQFTKSETIDFIALIGANALSGTTIRIRLGIDQAQVDGSALYDSGALPFIDPAIVSETGTYHSHLELAETVDATWWRIDIGGHTGSFSAACAIFGKRIIPNRFYDSSFEFGIDDLGTIDFSPLGVAAIEAGVIHRTLGFRLSWVSEAEYEAGLRGLAEMGRREVCYWCFDPEPGPYRQAKTYLGWMRQLPSATQQRKPRTYAIEFAIRSMI